MNDELKLRMALQFLALDSKQKFACLPRLPKGKRFAIFETHFITDNPLFCVGYECYNCIDKNKFGSDEFSCVLAEMECLLDAMISAKNHNWMWGLKTPGLLGSGHLFWHILRRLSKQALKMRNWPEATPTIKIDKFITVGRWLKSNRRQRKALKNRKLCYAGS